MAVRPDARLNAHRVRRAYLGVWARCLHSESYSVGPGCASTLGAGLVERQEGAPGFMAFLSLHADVEKAGKPMIHLCFLMTHVTRIFRMAQLIRHDLRGTFR